MFQDVKVGSRMLLKSFGFTLTAVLILALGIGANTAIFSLINALMLRLLPVRAPQELVLFSVAGPGVPSAARYNLNYPLYEMFRAEHRSLTDIITGAEPIVDPRPYDPKRFEASAWGKVADF